MMSSQLLLLQWLLVWFVASSMTIFALVLALCLQLFSPTPRAAPAGERSRRARAITLLHPFMAIHSCSQGSNVAWRAHEAEIRAQIASEVQALYHEDEQVRALLRHARAAVNRHRVGREVVAHV